MRRQKSTSKGKALQAASGSVWARPGMRRADELMEVATVAADARDLAEFLRLFSQRVAAMVSAEWCGVGVISGHDAELLGGTDSKALRLEKDEILALFKDSRRKKESYVVSVGPARGTTQTALFIVPLRTTHGPRL